MVGHKFSILTYLLHFNQSDLFRPILQYPPITVCVYRDVRKLYYDEVNAGGVPGEAIDEIRNMTEFPNDTRRDLITHLSYSNFSNGLDSKVLNRVTHPLSF